jgi:hypothetical protein
VPTPAQPSAARQLFLRGNDHQTLLFVYTEVTKASIRRAGEGHSPLRGLRTSELGGQPYYNLAVARSVEFHQDDPLPDSKNQRAFINRYCD